MDIKDDYSDFTKQIDAKSKDLIIEFSDHEKEVKAHVPDAEHGHIFEGWAIQKIAGLQVIVMKMTEDNERLRGLLQSRWN